MSTGDIEYPECERLSALSTDRAAVVDFIEWIGERGIRLCYIPAGYDHTFFPVTCSSESLVFEFLGIDPVKLERERRHMLDSLGRMQEND